jgi:hypothetical protein
MGMSNTKYDVNAHPGWYPESFALVRSNSFSLNKSNLLTLEAAWR